MARCNLNGTVAWNDPAAFETLALHTENYDDELFVRVRVRRDQNMSAGTKLLRIYYSTSAVYHDLFEATGHGCSGGGFNNAGNVTSGAFPTYWASAPGDNTCSHLDWHKIEYYFRQSTGTVRVWHDGILIRNDTGYNFQGVKWSPFYLVSSAEPGSDSTNYFYFDEIEIYSDRGSGATGLMSNASIDQ
jgi:hypothetical protein